MIREQFEARNRKHFADLIRHARNVRTLYQYGRLAQFGRMLDTTEYRVTFPYWTTAAPLNIHRTPREQHADTV